jgi:phosphatidylserine decarboxylase
VARPGYLRCATLALLALLAWWALPGSLGVVVGGLFTLLFVLVLQFYRDPHRVPPEGLPEGAVVSPADGRVVDVRVAEGLLHISIFLSPIDVHVNRAPVSGRVLELVHTPGRFLPAFDARASVENERVRLTLDVPGLGRITCVQVAGLVARRIENWIDVGQTLSRGQRYGMIHFGSRVDLALPRGLSARVQRGDRVKAGVSVLAGPDAG